MNLQGCPVYDIYADKERRENLVLLAQKCRYLTTIWDTPDCHGSLSCPPSYKENPQLALALCTNAARSRILGSSSLEITPSLWPCILENATAVFDIGWSDSIRGEHDMPQQDAIFVLFKERAAVNLFGTN